MALNGFTGAMLAHGALDVNAPGDSRVKTAQGQAAARRIKSSSRQDLLVLLLLAAGSCLLSAKIDVLRDEVTILRFHVAERQVFARNAVSYNCWLFGSEESRVGADVKHALAHRKSLSRLANGRQIAGIGEFPLSCWLTSLFRIGLFFLRDGFVGALGASCGRVPVMTAARSAAAPILITGFSIM